MNDFCYQNYCFWGISIIENWFCILYNNNVQKEEVFVYMYDFRDFEIGLFLGIWVEIKIFIFEIKVSLLFQFVLFLQAVFFCQII